MAHRDLKNKAIYLRKQGASYSQIKNKLGVSKSTLSGWLYDMPLSVSRIKELRDNSPIRIEKYRNTMRAKKEKRLMGAYKLMSNKIGKMTKREIFLAGLFLYWSEGTKRTSSVIEMTNTNPYMLKFFVEWFKQLDVNPEKIKVRLHLYEDMNIKKQTEYWSRTLSIPIKNFRNPYIKNSKLSSINYKSGYGQGTCSLIVGDADLFNKVIMGIKYLENSSLQ